MAAKKKNASSTAPTFRPPPGAPADLPGWRALYPEPEAQRTIDEIIAGLERTRAQGDSSVLHSAFEDEVGIPLKEQPADPYAWLCQAQSLWLTNVVPFDGLVLKDVRPLALFTQLKHLEINTSFDSDLLPLGALVKIKNLYVHGGEQSDWSWLAKLSDLEVLQVNASDDGYDAGVPAQRFSVSKNTKLKRFEWFGRYESIAHLGLGARLERINLTGQFTDISILQHIDALRELDLRNCQVRDITPLSKLKKLEVLDISRNQVASLVGIEALGKLAELDAQYNCISDFQPYRVMMEEEDQDDVEEWIEGTAKTQIALTTPEARAVYDDWLNLDKWKALATVLEASGDPMGEQVRLRMANDPKCKLPWFWARGTMTRDPSWK